jgi:excisionase family DNA binding protein
MTRWGVLLLARAVFHCHPQASIGHRERARQLIIGERSTRKKLVVPAAPKDLIMIGRAASILGVSVSTVVRWSNAGTLPTYRIGSRGDRRFRLANVYAMGSRRP